MTQDKIYYPETIENYPMGNTQEPESEVFSSSSKSVLVHENLIQTNFPVSQIASEVISRTLDTQRKKILGEYTFNQQGAFKVGTYKAGVSGEVALSSDGMTAINSSNVTTFAIDGDTGDATFGGTLTANVVVAVGALVVGTNVGLGTAQDSAGVTTIVGNTITTGYITALNLTVGTEIGLGTAQDSAGVTTIIGNVVTTGYVNALSVVAGSVSANNITAGTITGSTFRTASSGARVQINAAEAVINFYDVGNDLVGRLDEDGGSLFLRSFDGRNIDLISNNGAGDITIFASNGLNLNNNNISAIGAISMGGNIDMNGGDVNKIDHASFNSRNDNPSINWGFWAYSSGGTYEMRMKVNGDNYNIDRTAV